MAERDQAAGPMELRPFGGRDGQASVIASGGGGAGFIGSEAQRLRGLPLVSPTREGVIEDKEGFERLMEYVLYDEMHVDPSTFPLLLSEVPWNPRENREWLVELFFEKYKIPMLSMSMQSVLALYAAGRATGVVLEVGDSCCYSQSIYEGVFLDNTVHRGHLAGSDMSRHLMHLLQLDRAQAVKQAGAGIQLTQAALLEAAYSCKEKFAQVGPIGGGGEPPDVEFALPDGKVILSLIHI